MEAATARKDVIKRFWNIGREHSAIAEHLVRAPELSRDDVHPGPKAVHRLKATTPQTLVCVHTKTVPKAA